MGDNVHGCYLRIICPRTPPFFARGWSKFCALDVTHSVFPEIASLVDGGLC